VLDIDTKRRIDTARDILVGKVPDPKSQVEQITIALIYKFMDDMDAESEELGGKRKFFTGDYARYGWAKLMAPSLGGQEMLGLYGEGISKMPENPGIPALFRDIFKNAYLPYRDPETLKAFLKIIDEFSYDHSERLGDAFEYLLSVLGSQGDAGQFRTPRHIIDFMVAVLDPKKHETVLDPACGTAGFLISAYKHILRANSSPEGAEPNGKKRGDEAALHTSKIPRARGDMLTPDERGRLARNFKGYDISPDMVRLSLVNLYLHGFTDPHIYEYDTLTSDERWNEFADVILANPPFMSPKGGIKPHKRFSIRAKRSEVLFVDYMAEHLTPTGRAAIIVPEGIIFQSQTAYKELRKMLVENSLIAVVSLPAGCFNPYSGVKTSILVLDKSLGRQSQTIGFFKVENDGFGLGAQRRSIEKNDLPQVQAELAAYLRAIRSNESTETIFGATSTAQIVSKEKIAANGDYTLSGERYRDETATSHSFPLVLLGDQSLFRIEGGGTPRSEVEEYWGGGIPWATLVDLPSANFLSEITGTRRTISDKGLRESSAKMIPANSVVVSTRATIGRIAINRVPLATNQGFKNVVIEDSARVVPEFVALALTKLVPTMQAWATGGTFPEISKAKFCELKIPLPPLELQRTVVAEIEAYQKVVNGGRSVLDNYRPRIPIHPDWPLVELGKIARLINGRAYKQEELLSEGPTPVLRVGNFFSNRSWYYSDLVLDEEKYCEEGDLLYAWSASFGPRIWEGPRAIYHYHIWKIETSADVDKKFLFHLLEADSEKIKADGNGIAMVHATKGGMEQRKFPLPPLTVQRAIVAEIEAEQVLVAANRELISRFEQKIQKTLARIWGEAAPVSPEA
jgi:type I restriction enzyme M protein